MVDNMADFSTFHRMLIDFFADDDEDRMFQFRELQRSDEAMVLKNTKRESVPNVRNYIDNVINVMRLPQHFDDFQYHYRVSRHLFDIILGELYDSLLRKGKGTHETVTPGKQLLVGLCYLANNQSMREVAHIFDLSKSTVHKIVLDVCGALGQIGDRVIRWPSMERQREIARNVEQVCHIPGVVGFIDGTHIRLSFALGHDNDFYNRKGFPSIQLQIVVDDQMMITNVYTGWPGCTHDARVLRNSSLFQRAEAGELFLQNHHIFGDSAYPLRNWLITPFKNFGHLTPQQKRFNQRLSSVRVTIERAFGHLKGRFRRLREVPLHNAEEICKLIYAACILHNFCIVHEEDVEEYIQADENIHPNHDQNIFQNGHDGVVRRLQLVNLP
ncbi:hypothetical protein ACJMK2_011659 [Sinanodonta woodiana]|uniref:DDE Tnp4 domain-containing protein n=1 Tax=Sinanodonta woodiana TaxID=1069815 RepID=A0ABD3V825_SINWO